MNNNDVFKKLRVALMLQMTKIVDILKLVDFRMSKAEVNAFLRAEDSSVMDVQRSGVAGNFLNNGLGDISPVVRRKIQRIHDQIAFKQKASSGIQRSKWL
ncbi:MAG: DUF1456 family protein [Saprospiraceae bacterium]|nr:DUF1456 family protein [Candidatus Brachybacter algidus]MBK8749936.1 DUF1456 family protein [Candidatus Brachybacter algidus]